MGVVEPDYSHKLDYWVECALAEGGFNAFVKPPYKGPPYPSLVVIVIKTGRLDLAERLLSAGATMDASDFAHCLSGWRGAEIADLLLKHGVPHDATCFRAALNHEQWEAVFVLLAHGADIEAILPRSDGGRLLHKAALLGAAFAVRRLLRYGAEVDPRENQDMTPLMVACNWQDGQHKADADTVYWLLSHGANPNAQSPWGETPLLLCTGTKLPPYAVLRRTDTAKMLLEYGANPSVTVPKFETTALMFAARDDDDILARALLSAGADASLKTPDGKTARDVAEKRNSQKVLALLG